MAADAGKRKTSSGKNTKSSTSARKGTSERSYSSRTGSTRSTTGKKSRTARETDQRSVRENDPEQEEKDQALYHEISVIVLFVVLVILFCCNFGIIGPAGNAVSGFMFGIFGFLAYLLPVIVFLGTLFWVANKGNPTAVRKLSAAGVLFVMLEAVFELINGCAAGLDHYDFQALYDYSSQKKAGGGVLGGSVAYFFESNLGMIGAVLVILLCVVVSGILVTEKSLLAQMKNGGSRIRERSREESERRRAHIEEARERREEERQRREEERRQREEEEQLLRMEKKITGVTMDTSLKEEENEKPVNDIHEITYTESSPAKARQPEKETTEHAEDNENQITFEKIVPAKKDFEEEGFEEIKIRSILKTPSDLRAEAAIKSEPPKEDEADYFRFHENLKMRGNNLAGILNEYGQETDTQALESAEPAAETDGSRAHAERRADVSERERYTAVGSQTDAEVSRPASLSADSQQERTRESQNANPGARPVARFAEPQKSTGPVSAQEGTLGQKAFEAAKPVAEYRFPSIELLKKMKSNGKDSSAELKETAERLRQTLATFGVKVTITDISQGPSVTRYEFQPEPGVKVSKILSLQDDIKLNLAATDIRIEAPIPGKAAVGIEVPNKENTMVSLRELLESREFIDFKSNIAFAVGKDIAGKTIVADIAKMPHMLIAGSTGSGKSVCINTMIMSILYKAHPDDVKLIMVDPKVVELSVYNGIPHLLLDVVTDPKKASAALHWGVAEMDDRYKRLAEFNVRDIKEYNKKVEAMKAAGDVTAPAKMPQIVIIVDELADLMMVAPGEVEESICRLAQLARAAGIHLVIATQRPSVDVITGLIKANMPSRVAFAVSSGIDSRTILDMNGAEKLLGKGDMLFYPQGYTKPARVQGAFVSDEEVSNVVDFLKNQRYGNLHSRDIEEKIASMGSSAAGNPGDNGGNDRDEYFERAGRFLIDNEEKGASVGSLQRLLKIGFNRAARLMDQLCDYGVVGEPEGTKPRKVLMSMEEFEQLLEEII